VRVLPLALTCYQRLCVVGISMATIETDGARSNTVYMCLCASLSLWIHLANRYSAFTVLSASWNAGTTSDPHVIELAAAPDNKDASEALPLAPWS